jgi:predicted PurR-regulated permease PerM
VNFRIDPRNFLLGLTLLALWLAWLVVRPFAGVLFSAAVIATVMSTPTAMVARRIGGRRGAAAALVTVGTIAAVVAPVTTIVIVAVKQATEAVAWLGRALQHDGVEGLVAHLPESLRDVGAGIAGRLPHGAEELQAALQSSIGTGTMATVGGVVQATGALLGSLLLFFVALFFLLADGEALVDWLKRMLPLPPGRGDVLIRYFRTVTLSVVISTFATSGVQATLALVGYFIAGVPSALFFAFVTFFTSFIPAVGTLLVWLPLALLKLGTGHPVAAAFLVAWGLLVVGMADNVVRPMLIKRGVSFPVGLVFFALLGGIAAFGPVGIFAGPLTLAFLVATIQAWHEW